MYADIIRQIGQRGVEFGIGLSDEEFCWITDEYGIVFSQELKNLYKEALPVSEGFYNWRDKRDENVEKIKEVMESPVRWIVKNSKEIDWNEKWEKGPFTAGHAACRSPDPCSGTLSLGKKRNGAADIFFGLCRDPEAHRPLPGFDRRAGSINL